MVPTQFTLPDLDPLLDDKTHDEGWVESLGLGDVLKSPLLPRFEAALSPIFAKGKNPPSAGAD